jgi:hypothetical protein
LNRGEDGGKEENGKRKVEMGMGAGRRSRKWKAESGNGEGKRGENLNRR